jgi:cyclopropane fatty-acyl-phospholipid synthase-like methyltransferase
VKDKNQLHVYENYEKIADWFDEHCTKDLMEREYLERILQHIPPHSHILDLGCGTGEPMAQFFIERGYQVTGIDGSEKMIDYCKKRFPSMNWILQDMRTIDLKKKFDVVLAWDSFFHLNHSDQRAMFQIFEKHLKPAGILLFTGGPDEGEEWSQMDGHDFYHASLSSEEYRDLLKAHNFTTILHRIEDPNCGEHTVWIAQLSPQ